MCFTRFSIRLVLLCQGEIRQQRREINGREEVTASLTHTSPPTYAKMLSAHKSTETITTQLVRFLVVSVFVLIVAISHVLYINKENIA